jgi:hypothetical protein
MPQTAALALEFVLRDANVKDIYRVQYSLPKSTQRVVSPPGVRGLNVSNLSPLEIGQEYHWELALICNPSDRSKDIVVEGWVKRVKADPTLARRIQQTTPPRACGSICRCSALVRDVGDFSGVTTNSPR